MVQRKLGRTQEFLKPIVFGGNDGIVTTFAIVAGFAGAQADGVAEIGGLAVLLFGLANLLADAVSMGMGEFLSGRSQHQLYRSRDDHLRQRLDEDRETHRNELSTLLQARGMDPDDAETASALFAKRPELMRETILRYSEGLTSPDGQSPALNGLVTFLAFVIFGILPLVPYFLMEATGATFRLSLATTLLALLALGTLRRNATGEPAGRAIGETVLVGGICSAVAFLVGVVVGG